MTIYHKEKGERASSQQCEMEESHRNGACLLQDS